MYKTDKSDGIRIELTKVKKLYKQKIFSAQKEYDAKFHKELRGLKKSQPQAYWKVINSSNGMKENKIPLKLEISRNISEILVKLLKKIQNITDLSLETLLQVTNV